MFDSPGIANLHWDISNVRCIYLYYFQEPKEFLVAYEEMVSWTSDGANWSTIEDELSKKGVKVTYLDYVALR